MGARRSQEERAAQSEVFLLMSYLCRQNFTDSKYRHKADPTGAYRNFGGEGFRGRRWEPEAHSDMPKVAKSRLSTAWPCVCEQEQLGPATLCGPRVTQGKLCRYLQPHGHFRASCALDLRLHGWDVWSEERSPGSCWLGLVGGFRNRRGLEGHPGQPLSLQQT